MKINKTYTIIGIICCIIIICLCICCCSMNSSNEHMTSLSIDAEANVLATHSTPTTQNIEFTGNLNVTESFNLLPAGIITAWNSTTAPPGWVLCVGPESSGIPDLRDRFIFGTGKKSYHTKGGSETIAIQNENMPVHSHTYNQRSLGNEEKWVSHLAGTERKITRPGYNYAIGSTSSVGSNTFINIMPSYHVLTYIMKI